MYTTTERHRERERERQRQRERERERKRDRYRVRERERVETFITNLHADFSYALFVFHLDVSTKFSEGFFAQIHFLFQPLNL